MPAGQRDQSAAALPIVGRQTVCHFLRPRFVFTQRVTVFFAWVRTIQSACIRARVIKRVDPPATRARRKPRVARRARRLQPSAERVAIRLLHMIGFGVRVGGRAHSLEIAFRHRRFVSRQPARRTAVEVDLAGREDESADGSCGSGEEFKQRRRLNVRSRWLLTVIHKPRQENFRLFLHRVLNAEVDAMLAALRSTTRPHPRGNPFRRASIRPNAIITTPQDAHIFRRRARVF